VVAVLVTAAAVIAAAAVIMIIAGIVSAVVVPPVAVVAAAASAPAVRVFLGTNRYVRPSAYRNEGQCRNQARRKFPASHPGHLLLL
jgi:hypothetical protein